MFAELRGLLSVPGAERLAGACGRHGTKGRRLLQPPSRPVLKHGPRTLTRARGVRQYETRKHSEGKRGEILLVGASPADPIGRVLGVEQERACWDPKDGELCLNRLKPEETLVEGRSGSDVQIDRRIWA